MLTVMTLMWGDY